MDDTFSLNVAQLLKSAVGEERRYHFDLPPGGLDDLRLVGTTAGNLQLVRLEGCILARAGVDTSVEQECSRCLAAYAQALHVEFEEQYFPTVDIVTGAPLAVAASDEAFTIDGSHVLDLTEALRQYIEMALPMHPLCGENCAGLCPTCGQDLNQGACTCVEDVPASPFAALRGLLQQP